MSPEERLASLGIVLPEPPTPLAAYVPFVVVDDLVFVSGQVPLRDGVVAVTGQVGGMVSIEDGVNEARTCAVNILAQLRKAAGSLDSVRQIVKLGVFVASAPGFNDQPAVANGASELFVEVFGDGGRHARAAVGVAELPLGVCVEVDAVVRIG